MRPCKARAVGRKLDWLNPNPQRCNRHTHRHSVYRRCSQERPAQLSRVITTLSGVLQGGVVSLIRHRRAADHRSQSE